MRSAIASMLEGFVGGVSGDRVVLVVDPRVPVDPAVLDAVDAEVRARGGEVVRFESPPFDPRTEDAPADLAEALSNADVAIDFADHESLVHTAAGRRLVRAGTLRLVAVSLRRAADWATPFALEPVSRLFARARAAADRLLPGGEARLTAPNGTDLAFRVRPGSVIGMPGGAQPEPMRRGRGGFGLYPAGAIGTSPESARGVVVLDGIVGIRGALARPVRLEVADGRVVRVDGGPEAAWLRERIEAHENGGFVAKVLAGIHPAAPLEEGLRELDRRKSRLSRREGVVLVGLGDARSIGGTVASTWHGDGVVLGPVDWSVGGRPLFVAGQLQALPESVRWGDVPAGEPHQPRLLGRAGELVAVMVDVRGPMPHAHRNPESDELWIPLAGGPVAAGVEGAAAPIPIRPGDALLLPRGVAHRADGPATSSPMLVIERVPSGASPSPVARQGFVPASEPVAIDLETLSRAYTPPWTRGARPLARGPSFVIEGYSRPEGMLRPEEPGDAPELWVILRGAVGVEEGSAAPHVRVEAGSVMALPPGGPRRVVSLRPDTVALRIVGS
jgi:mannose-6-phosphate isomerase-like protein (cupin superfamily)